MARFPKGSNPKLNEVLIDRLTDAIRRGAYVETAVALVGLSKQTFYRWLRQAEAEDADELLLKLSDAVKKGMAEAELRDLAVIDAAAQGGVWQAAAWRLERKHPERWGRQSKVQMEHSGPEGKPIQIEDRRERLRKLLEDPASVAAIETIEGRLNEPEH